MICFVMTSWPQPRQSVDLLALVVGLREAEAVRLRGRRGGAGAVGVALIVVNPSSRASRGPRGRLDDRRRVEGEAVVLADGDEARRELGELVAQDRDELAVAVLLDDVDALVAPDPRRRLGPERQRAEAAVVERHAELGGEPVAGLGRAVVRRAEREEPRRGARAVLDLGLRHERPRRVELPREAVHVVRRSPAASRSTAPSRCGPEPRVKNAPAGWFVPGSVRYGIAVAVHVPVAAPRVLHLLDRRRVEDLAAVERRRRDTGTGPTSSCSSRGRGPRGRRPASGAARRGRRPRRAIVKHSSGEAGKRTGCFASPCELK